MRRCAQPGCITILSERNPDEKCFLHQVPRFGAGIGSAVRRMRQEELEGKHPEALEHIDRPFTDEEWEAFKRRHLQPWRRHEQRRNEDA
jgi:hypothetical protein